jgi:hypothetical protein
MHVEPKPLLSDYSFKQLVLDSDLRKKILGKSSSTSDTFDDGEVELSIRIGPSKRKKKIRWW